MRIPNTCLIRSPASTHHSPLLPDLLPAEALYVCQRHRGGSTIQRLDDVGPLFRDDSAGRRLDGPHGEMDIVCGDVDG
jgi:hypothetical protein